MVRPTCTVEVLSCPDGFRSGDTVSGQIVFEMKEPIRFDDIILEVVGTARCNWVEESAMDSMTYESFETLFKYDYVLAIKNEELSELGVGTLSFNFSFRLPDDLPSTYHGEKGDISYSATVVIRQPKMKRLRYVYRFDLKSRLDLNTFEFAKRPIVHRESRKFQLFSRNRGVIDIKFEVPNSGFVVGEKIPMTFTIINHSKVDIISIKVGLFKVVNCISSSPLVSESYDKKLLVKCSYAGVSRNTTKSLSVSDMVVPETLPSTLDHCPIIKISYLLKVKIRVMMIYKKITFKIPIIIGTVPLDYDDLPPPYEEPPSYEEAMRNLSTT